MGKNDNLGAAKAAKNDEFYTQYTDIQKEVNSYVEYDPDVFRDKTILLPCDDPEWSNFTKFFAQNFERFGLKKLISTSFAVESKRLQWGPEPTLWEMDFPDYDVDKAKVRGKIFTLERDRDGNGRIDIDDLEYSYLEGNGDFNSPEVRLLRDEADVIVTNPPFSVWIPFFNWICEAKKKFLIIANKNSVTYKEVFPYIKRNECWSGRTEWAGGMWFETKDPEDVDRVVNGVNMKNIPSIWLTNLEHGRRHEPLRLMSMKDNLRFSKHKEVREKGYPKYVNYDAIEVPYSDSIPSDYDGEMGVPVSFLDKYCPEQFEIVGHSLQLADMNVIKRIQGKAGGGPRFYVEEDGNLVRLYERLVIRKKQ